MDRAGIEPEHGETRLAARAGQLFSGAEPALEAAGLLLEISQSAVALVDHLGQWPGEAS